MPQSPLNSSIEEKIAWAQKCHESMSATLLADERIEALLLRLRQAHQSASDQMHGAGVVALCKSCEEDDGGSCCGAGIENRYDGIMLLINLLLGIPLPSSRMDRSSCYFLGRKGCRLAARQPICINYVCDRIECEIDRDELAEMRLREGPELETVFLLHARIKEILNHHG